MVNMAEQSREAQPLNIPQKAYKLRGDFINQNS
jgi:hypothetical protein